MAVIELNALSVSLSGSFSATIFAPENHSFSSGRSCPALYLLHDIGGDDTDVRAVKNLEALATELSMFIIAPSVMHSFGMDLRWGGKYGAFVGSELPGICRHMFPLDPARCYIGGVGWGAYGALMQTINRPDAFGKCIAINGSFDIASLCERAAVGEETPNLTRPMLEALFAPLGEVRGGRFDLLSGGQSIQTPVYLGCETDSPALEENMRFSKVIGAALHTGADEEDLFASSLNWLRD